MATTTAAVTLTSDLLSDALSVSASTTCMKAGTTADGLDQMEYGVVEIATGTAYDIICSTPTASKASKLYIKNHSTDETYYVSVVLDAQAVGRLYGGDWMFIPADFHDANADIEITSSGGTNIIEYALFHEGTILTAS
jgi:hypothetical protein|tara:strand:- start:284 stop:697 length:414 start_codon:yes stop_codon:yes gene_type:complete